MPTQAQVEAQLAAVRGSYVEVVAHRAPFVFMAQTMYFFFFFLWRCGGMMLLGMGLHKWGFLDGSPPIAQPCWRQRSASPPGSRWRGTAS